MKIEKPAYKFRLTDLFPGYNMINYAWRNRVKPKEKDVKSNSLEINVKNNSLEITAHQFGLFLYNVGVLVITEKILESL